MKSVLEFDSLELSFDGRKILSSIYMKCCQGEVVGLLGRNGSGKSSLMKVVFGMLQAEHKSLRVDGHSLHGDHIRKRIIGYLPQEKLIPKSIRLLNVFRLFKIDVEETISIFPEVRDLLHFNRDQLSGGSMRLIESLIILQSQAKFCLLDEPFTGLMPIHIESLKNIILKMKQQKGIILSDHMYRNVIDVSDRIYALSNGKTYEINERERLVELGYVKSL